MNTFTNSTVMVEYAKSHSAELRRQAHLANGGSVYASNRSTRSLTWLTGLAGLLTTGGQMCVRFFGSFEKVSLWSQAEGIPHTGANNG